MEKRLINEDMHLEEEWYAEARKMTLEKLPEFIRHVMNDYVHDYGTVVKAVNACALAAAWTANEEEGSGGGITGFQASCVMWEFIKSWQKTNNKCGLKLIDYDDMLYPQCDYKFEKTISRDNWEAVKAEAKKKVEEADADIERDGETWYHPSVLAHLRSVAKGVIPFGYKIEEE